MAATAVTRLFWELHSRRVFRTVGLYVIGSWAVLQAADILFPGWGIPEAAIRYLVWAILLGLPVVIAFAWVFDVSTTGIRRAKQAGDTTLKRADYLILAGFVVALGLIANDAIQRVLSVSAPDVASPSTQPAARPARAQSIAVLPFDNLSPDPEQVYFADGISEEILNRLSVFPDLTVIARTSSFAFKDSGYDVPRITELLGVEYLLQGSIRRDAQRLRISAQLVSRDGVQVWVRSFDREMGSVFALYDEIAEAVATSILPTITARPTADRIPDLDAYEEYLIGRSMLANRVAFSGTRARPHFDRAIEIDPDFIEPYAERAVTHIFHPTDERYLERAQLDIDRALALRADHPRTLAVQALLLGSSQPDDVATREALLRRSLALDPNQVDAWNWLSGVLGEQGRNEEAEVALTRALLLDPLAPAPNVNMAQNEMKRGDLDAAERRLTRLLQAPDPPPMWSYALFTLYVMSGRVDEANDVLWRLTDDNPDMTGLIFTYALLDLPEAAERLRVHQLAEQPSDTLVGVLHLTITSLDRDAAPDAYLQAQELVDEAALTVTGMGGITRLLYGSLASLYDDHATAIRVLEPLFRDGTTDFVQVRRATHALAWSYQQTGQSERARALLEPLAQHDRQPTGIEEAMTRFELGTGYVSSNIAGRALTLLLVGEEDAAMERLEQAVELGWRGKVSLTSDPRWRPLHDRPRFQALLANLDELMAPQRNRIRARDAEHPLEARLEAAL